MNLKNLSAGILTSAILLISCGSSNNSNSTNESADKTKTEDASVGKIYFSCSVGGKPLSDNSDGGIIDPVTNMLLNSGENEDYTVGIRIPVDLKPGQSCTGCKGFVHEKIRLEGGITQRKIYELVQNVTITVKERKKGYAAGTFSFSVKLKEDSDKIITVTNGKFGMSVINDE
jgi:hypothetical protein